MAFSLDSYISLCEIKESVYLKLKRFLLEKKLLGRGSNIIEFYLEPTDH